jgi:hypothetical protein
MVGLLDLAATYGQDTWLRSSVASAIPKTNWRRLHLSALFDLMSPEPRMLGSFGLYGLEFIGMVFRFALSM